MVTSASSWDVKAMFMGTSALVALEDSYMDAQGRVAMKHRYDWTRGSWNNEYTQFRVTFTAQHASGPGPREERRLLIRPAELGL